MTRPRILFYAHYYAPDVASTGQIAQDLAEGLTDEYDVTVICTIPSYSGKIDKKYGKRWFYHECINNVNVIRVSVPVFNKGSKLSRINNLLFYFFNARRATKMVGSQDYILAISQPPIMGGILGVYGKRRLRSECWNHPKLIYNIQDFNPEQIAATRYIKNRGILAVALMLDKKNCLKSDCIVTVGRDLADTLERRFIGKTTPKHVVINNWIDEKEIHPLSPEDDGVIGFREKYGLENKFVIMYSGNIGLYYDLDGLIKVIEKFEQRRTEDGRDVAFVFVGEGSLLAKLKRYKKEHKLSSIVFIPYQEKGKLIYSLNAADVHWCVNARGIKGVSCPSKFYGIASVGKPILAVLEKGSEIEMLISKIGCGKVSEPGEYEIVENNIEWFIANSCSSELREMGNRGRQYLINHLGKSRSIGKYKKAIKSI